MGRFCFCFAFALVVSSFSVAGGFRLKRKHSNSKADSNFTQDPVKAYKWSSERFEQVSVGETHACAIRASDKSLICRGHPGRSAYCSSKPQRFGAAALVSTAGADGICKAKAADMSVRCWEGCSRRHRKMIKVPEGLGAVRQIAGGSGGDHTCAIKAADLSVLCWNWQGELPVPENLGAALQISMGGSYEVGLLRTCVVKAADRSVACFGDDWGDDWDDWGGYAEVPKGLGAVEQVTVGHYHTCAVKAADKSVVCWRAEEYDYGQAEVPKELGAVKQVSAGYMHTCAVKAADGSVVCWGLRERDYYSPDPPKGLGAVKQISVGDTDTCAIMAADGSIVCWRSRL